MAVDIKLKRGTAAAIKSYVGTPGEVLIDTTNWGLVVCDGKTVGGNRSVVMFNGVRPDDNGNIEFDDSKYATTNNPTTSGVFTHNGNGLGNTDIVLRIQSNNAQLTGYGDVSSAFHFGGVPVSFDTLVNFHRGFTFPTYGGDLTGNATSLKQFSRAEFTAQAINYVVTGCDFNGYPTAEQQNFIVKNHNADKGTGDNWSYQSYNFNSDTSQYDRTFGVKADGTIVSKGSRVVIEEDISDCAKCVVYGSVRDRDSSKPTYNLV